MELRRALPEDWPAIAEVYIRSGRQAFWWVEPDVFHPGKLAEWTQAGEAFYLALEGDQVLGMMTFRPADNYLHNLFVAPEAQGRGVGTALLALAEQIADGPVSLKCDAKNQPALDYYRRRGLEPFEEGRRDNGEAWVMMRRR